MRSIRIAVAALLAAQIAGAQQVQTFGPEIRPFVGMFIPTGNHRDDFKDATMLGGQVAFELSEYFHVVSTVSWTHGHAKFGGLTATDNTYIWQYDIGAEFGLMQSLNDLWYFRPFVGTGAGGRTYDYRSRNVGDKTCTAGYGTVGAEFQRDILGLRIEGRGYANCFEQPVTRAKKTRYDFGLMFGLAYHIW